ncbi:MAG: serine protease, partial [Alphaproteobacteria bacterium]|nr:serine protease [Alphaproteobacteria bacterium]
MIPSDTTQGRKKGAEYTASDFSVFNAYADGLINRDRAYTGFRITELLRLRIKTALLAILGFLITVILIFFIYNLFKGNSIFSGPVTTRTVVEYVPVPDPSLSEVIEKQVIVQVPQYIPVEIPSKEGVVTNFNIFQSVEPSNAPGVLVIKTGAAFSSSKSTFPTNQWCYGVGEKMVANQQVNFNIANVDGRSAPVKSRMTEVQASEAGISIKTFSRLFQYCQFIQGNDVAGGASAAIPIEKDGDQGVASGTAFAVNGDGYFVTNEHVVQSCSSIGIVMNEKIYPATIYNKDPKLDLAIIKASPSLASSYIKFAPEVRTGQSVTALGFPLSDVLGIGVKVTTGIISSMSGYEGNNTNMQFSAAIQPGNSGGPLVDQFNRLVGVTTAALIGEDIQNLNFAVKAANVQRFLGANRIDFDISTSNTQIDIPTI